MKDLLLQPTSLAHWHALVNQAQLDCAVELGEDLESYLVFLLMRFTENTDLSKSILALEFLESLHKVGNERTLQLQEVGDKCLLYTGFYPDLIQRRRLKENYYIDLGQNAYYALASVSQFNLADLFQSICDEFLLLRDILKAMKPEELDSIALEQYSKHLDKTKFKTKPTRH